MLNELLEHYIIKIGNFLNFYLSLYSQRKCVAPLSYMPILHFLDTLIGKRDLLIWFGFSKVKLGTGGRSFDLPTTLELSILLAV